MREITVVTGPLRSGTSCLTGLLERCGFDLGSNVRVLRKPSEHNPLGHFEPDLLFAINSRLNCETGQGDGIVDFPDARAIARLGAQRQQYFDLFIERFDGQLCKDPLFCLTLPLWEQHWPQLTRAIFCLRHPLAVASSIEKRYRFSSQHALQLWHVYTTRFFEGVQRCDVFVFDFDAFGRQPIDELRRLLDWLGRPLPSTDVSQALHGFWDESFVHWKLSGAEVGEPYDSLYRQIKSRACANECNMRPPR